MFVAHFGLGFASKRLAATVSLGLLFLAAQLLDLVWPILLLLDVETVAIAAEGPIPLTFVSFPYSHSLLMAVVWGGLLGGVYYALRRDGFVAAVLGGLVVSHWLLDFVVHVPDLPLYPGGPLIGLGLWNVVWAALVLEFAVLAAGVYVYADVTTATDRIGRYGFWALVALLAIVQVGNTLGPAPPSADAVAFVGIAQWLLVGIGFWVDRHRITG